MAASGKKNMFNEATRVQMPAMVHLTRLGYTYFGKITEDMAGTVYDPDTNILIDVFKEQFARLNPTHVGEAEQTLKTIRQELDNDDIGRSFYERLSSVSPVRLVDFENPQNNTYHFTAEFTCKRDQDEFRPDITLFVNGLPLVFVEVKKPNNHGGMVAESKRMNQKRFPNKKFRRFLNITQLMIFSNNMEYDTIECYDPSAGTGTLLMALAHKIGEDKCTIFAQDISQRSNKMLKLNLILNSLVSSLDHAIQGDTLIAPYHKSDNGQELRTFDYVVSNPPFKMDFSDTRERIAAMPVRFWAGVPKVPAKKKESMAIYTLFIQHVLNSLKSTGKGAIVVPTGFVTAKSGVEKKILQHIVDEHIVYGCISMPSNVFANTGTNVSVLFFDNSRKTDKVVLIDASKLGEEYKDGNNQKRRLRDFEIDKIVDTFLNKEAVDDFSVAVTYDEIKEKKYSLAAGQYFDVKIEYVELSQDEFNARMSAYAEKLQEYFAEGDKLKTEIMEQLKKVKYE